MKDIELCGSFECGQYDWKQKFLRTFATNLNSATIEVTRNYCILSSNNEILFCILKNVCFTSLNFNNEKVLEFVMYKSYVMYHVRVFMCQVRLSQFAY